MTLTLVYDSYRQSVKEAQIYYKEKNSKKYQVKGDKNRYIGMILIN